MEITTFLLLVALALGAGFLGALLGLGGGIILVPGLTLLFHYNFKIAAAASLASVIATSSAAATVYVRERITNVRLGMLLETGTTAGALIGAVIAVFIHAKYLYFIFAAVLLYAGLNMLRGRKGTTGNDEEVPTDSKLSGEFLDPSTGKTVTYDVHAVPIGMAGSVGAGILSGLLGVGGGIIKVPLMNLVMGIPMKAAIATSNFMIGVTAATSALVYWKNGLINPFVTAPTAIGVLIGARIGTRVAGKAKSRALVIAFVILIVVTAVQMIFKGMHVK